MCALCYIFLLSIHPISSGFYRDFLSLIRTRVSVRLPAWERRKCAPSLSLSVQTLFVRCETDGRQTNFQFLIEQNQANSMRSTRPNSPTSHGIYTSGVATVVSVYPSACHQQCLKQLREFQGGIINIIITITITLWPESASELYTERPPLVGEISANFCG
jgi:hypothetical protein